MSDEDSADEMEDDCKLMNGDVSIVRLCAAFNFGFFMFIIMIFFWHNFFFKE